MTPIVAIVGRPNVGKSTLFNRLAGQPLAIVDDTPGVTRDRHYAATVLQGREVTLIDTGGFDPTSDDPMGLGIARHVRAAMDEADAVICVFDGTTGPTEPDRDAVGLLRRCDRPVIYVANKIDNPSQELCLGDLYALGIGDLIAVSALHGRHTGRLEAALVAALPAPAVDADPPPADAAPRVALVGRPNAGKSSLLNHLAGSERSLVDDRPGTTRDPVDASLCFDGRSYVVVDTAGIRRRARVDPGLESVSVVRAIRALERAQVVVLVCDGTATVAEQDARLLQLTTERGRAVLIALNKSDLLTARDRSRALVAARDALHFAPWVPILPVSAKHGTGVKGLMQAVWQSAQEFARRIPTGELNRFFEEVLARHPPPTSGGKAPRLYYITQAQSAPPVFVAMSSAPDAIQTSYRRFLQNQIRERFGFTSIPIRVVFKQRSRRER